MYLVPLADVEMRLDRAACVAPGQSKSASPSHQAVGVPDDRLSARRCRSLEDAAEAVRRAQGYVAPWVSWMPAGRIGAATARHSPADGAPARRGVCAIARRTDVARRAPARRCAGRTRTGSS